MKTFIILTVLLAANTMWAQLGPAGREFSKPAPNLAGEAADLKPGLLKPNEIAGTRADVTYSGILVQVKKTDNPLQLINPFAPAEYGYGEQNFSRDITPRREGGLKFFSIDY